MPELPEVETIRRGLEKYLVGSPRASRGVSPRACRGGHKIEKVEVRYAGTVKEGDTKKVEGAKFTKIRRFGKALVFDLDPSTRYARSGQAYSIATHIKLTGQFVYKGPKVPKSVKTSKKYVDGLPNKHTHVIFYLDRGATLYFSDIRKFAWIKIIPTSEVEKMKFINELGPEPIRLANARSGQAPLTLKKFREILSKSKTKIKALLMDQTKISGVGNIYANDALFLAGIDPSRPAKSLSPKEVEKLYHAIEVVLKRGLKYGGATELNFVNALGEEGGYQKHFLVYGQDGKPCPGGCGGKVQKNRIGGRGTYYCPNCQK